MHEIRWQIAARENAHALGTIARRMPRSFHRLPTAFDEQPLLRVHQRRFPIAQPEEAWIEVGDPVQDRPRLDEVWMRNRIGRHPERRKFGIAEPADRRDPGNEIAPQRFGIVGTRKPARHPDHGDIDCATTRDLSPLARRSRGRRHPALYVPRQGLQCGMIKNVDHIKPRAKRRFCRQSELNCEQGMPAHVEEVVAALRRFAPQHLPPDRPHPTHHAPCCNRRNGNHRNLRNRQSLPVNLARRRRNRHLRQRHQH